MTYRDMLHWMLHEAGVTRPGRLSPTPYAEALQILARTIDRDIPDPDATIPDALHIDWTWARGRVVENWREKWGEPLARSVSGRYVYLPPGFCLADDAAAPRSHLALATRAGDDRLTPCRVRVDHEATSERGEIVVRII